MKGLALLLQLALLVGLALAAGPGGAQPAEAPIAVLERQAAGGSAEAMFKLGIIYAQGEGAARDDAKAMGWFQRAAEKSDGPAMLNLGMMHWFGLGAPESPETAAAWFFRAARTGDPDGINEFRRMYTQGYVIPRDAAEAAVMAELGQGPIAGYSCGRGPPYVGLWGRRCDQRGHDPLAPRDFQARVQWYREKAEAGDTAAMIELYRTLNWEGNTTDITGLGTDAYRARRAQRDGYLAEGAMWLNRAADSGNLQALDFAADRDAAAYRRRAAEAGAPKALAWVARDLFTGVGGQAGDAAAAIALVRRALSLDEARARAWLAPEVVEAGPQGRAFAETVAAAGDAETALTLAEYYRNGALSYFRHSRPDYSRSFGLTPAEVAAQDRDKAREYYSMAAQAGSTEAMRTLADAFIRVGDMGRDSAAGTRWMLAAIAANAPNWVYTATWPNLAASDEGQKAVFPHLVARAQTGDVEAMRAVAAAYAVGAGTAVDETQAIAWMRRAGANTDAAAAREVSEVVWPGRGSQTARDLQRRWLTRAAEGGDLRAMDNLATALMEERDEKPSAEDYAQAARWYDRARKISSAPRYLAGYCSALGRGAGVPAAMTAECAQVREVVKDWVF